MQAYVVPAGTDLAEAAFAEPLAVTLHAVLPGDIGRRAPRAGDRLRADRRVGGG